ncbi:MAG: FHA domain-containing protein [Aggregatilineales bacterium]
MTNKCTYCGASYRTGTLFCEDCGQSLILGDTEPLTLPARKMKTVSEVIEGAVSRITTEDPLYIYVRGSQNPIILHSWNRQVVGRIDDNGARKPDIDLTPFGALEKGVSRIHAMFEQIGSVAAIVDMNSRNGVALNGEQIHPGKPYILHDGDEVHFGELITHIYFR